MITTSKIIELSDREHISNTYRVIKLMEESGELAAAFLHEERAENRSASQADNDPDATLEEGADTLIATLDILYALGYDDHQINTQIATKTAKWKRKVDRCTGT